MKILLLSSTFPPRPFGGITAVSYHLARSLVRRGHEVTVYTTDIKDSRSRIADAQGIKNLDGINVRYFRNISNSLASKRLYLPRGAVAVTRGELDGFDIIHLNEFRSFQTIIVHHYARKYRIPYVLQTHGSLGTYFQKGVLKRIFDRIWGYRILKDAAKLIALTPVEAGQYRDTGIIDEKIATIPNGINLSEFESLPERGEFRRKYSLSRNQKIILCLARIHKIKGHDLLVRAFADLSKPLDDTKLVIVGPDDGYLLSLERLVANLGISDKVLFTGPLYGQEKLEAYVDADVYVLPSVYEIFGITVLEALACGKPVIVTDRCGLADFINGQAGLVVSYSQEQLGSALRRMLDDDQMRLQFGERGKLLMSEQFNWEKIAEQMETVYQEILK